MKIEGVEKYRYATLSTDSPECVDKTEELRKKLKGKARFVFSVIVDDWGEGVIFADGKYHISCDGDFWNWDCKEIGKAQPKSTWVTRFSGSAKEAQQLFEKWTPDFMDDGRISGFM